MAGMVITDKHRAALVSSDFASAEKGIMLRPRRLRTGDKLRNDKQITELPFYAEGKKCPSDRYYTDREIAKGCIDAFMAVCQKRGLSLQGYTFVEPSAGEGCFYDSIPGQFKRIALDIDPGPNAAIRQADFLQWYPEQEGRYVVIGNPPFGHRGALALAFVNRSLLFVDVVGFILPMSFYSNGKGSNMKRVEGAALIHNEVLPRTAFYLPESETRVSVNTVFQVWLKGETQSVFAEFDVSEYVDIYTCCSLPRRFCGLGRGRDYDCFIASTFYGNKVGIVRKFDDVAYGCGYGFVIKKEKRRVLGSLKRMDWTRYCSDATNHCKHIRIHHIQQALGECGFGVER